MSTTTCASALREREPPAVSAPITDAIMRASGCDIVLRFTRSSLSGGLDTVLTKVNGELGALLGSEHRCRHLAQMNHARGAGRDKMRVVGLPSTERLGVERLTRECRAERRKACL